jgi:hypothetical protein
MTNLFSHSYDILIVKHIEFHTFIYATCVYALRSFPAVNVCKLHVVFHGDSIITVVRIK